MLLCKTGEGNFKTILILIDMSEHYGKEIESTFRYAVIYMLLLFKLSLKNDGFREYLLIG